MQLIAVTEFNNTTLLLPHHHCASSLDTAHSTRVRYNKNTPVSFEDSGWILAIAYRISAFESLPESGKSGHG
ncbi:hypothetical protein LshimejAT787_1302150 [Lyophyllum shimeji]|uniref:Uncharacterized protein n=1 Tax=Lyophyllum shimeji TaxID=47721 RepID=A0A9P3UPY6_LYOSH|nr:hypothetical protein LshimejAT787_1302150 [Lyophyllum shimeji]